MMTNCRATPPSNAAGITNTRLKSLGVNVNPIPSMINPNPNLIMPSVHHAKEAGQPSATTATIPTGERRTSIGRAAPVEDVEDDAVTIRDGTGRSEAGGYAAREHQGRAGFHPRPTARRTP